MTGRKTFAAPLKALREVLIASAIVALATPVCVAADEVICGKDWISFEPLHPDPFSAEQGLNAYLVQKDDILRGSAAKRGVMKDFGYIILPPLEGDARPDGVYRVTREAYLTIRDCLIGEAP